MLGLLDRAAQLRNLKRETLCPGPLTCGATLKTTALAATLLLLTGILATPVVDRLHLPFGARRYAVRAPPALPCIMRHGRSMHRSAVQE
jgi:hypothetical protein